MNKVEAEKLTPDELSKIIGEVVDSIWTIYEDKLEYVLNKDFVEDVYDEDEDEYERGYVNSHWIYFKDLK